MCACQHNTQGVLGIMPVYYMCIATAKLTLAFVKLLSWVSRTYRVTIVNIVDYGATWRRPGARVDDQHVLQHVIDGNRVGVFCTGQWLEHEHGLQLLEALGGGRVP